MRAALGLDVARPPDTCALIMCVLVRMKPNESTKASRIRKWGSLPGRLDVLVVGPRDVVPELSHAKRRWCQTRAPSRGSITATC